MSVRNYTARGAQKYLQNREGHIAVVSGLLGLPLLLMVGVALDVGNASAKRANIAAGIDAAALASVIPANLDEDERIAFAKKAFTENYFGKQNVNLDVKATRERVDIVARAQIPTYLSGIVGKDYINVSENASAIVTTSDVVCVLALDPVSKNSLEFSKNAQFVAPSCSVQVNSTAAGALVSKGSYRPQAQSFCVAGTSKGHFNGTLKHACTPLNDPYKGIPEPVDGPCIALSKLKTKGNSAIDKAYLYPGTYCDGLDVMGTDVTFAPGTYIFPKGKLRLRKGSQSTAKGVTFILKDKVTFWMEDGAELNLTAPSDGPYAGLALYQAAGAKKGGSKNRIRSGAGVSITGTVYLPNQRLEISSESPVISEAPATSFIAHNILFTGDAKVRVNVDHEKGGLPPIMPRSDEGARLVK
ncbi:MAG: hypothetical protein EX271_02760 [Acidimicrobiales bacterium]|nr:hypothetical protein [Hyphomonadaceae bacterium]RZV43984.1 MAG: hypothetical protein EX271_02760 [Acidimicrobiales bacterium]